ncbi:MAG TPA: MFS transporter [Steroidobacteraceae bacterium]
MAIGAAHQAARTTLVLCVCAALCEGIDLQAAGVAAAGLSAAIHPTTDQLGTFFSASTFGLFFGAIIGGRLGDSFGRKKVLVASVATFGIFSLLTVFATDIQALIWARILTGLGLGGAFPMLLALVAETSSARYRTASISIMYAAAPVGGALVSLVSAMIAASHWRAIFALAGAAPLLLTPLLLWALPESAAFQQRRRAATDTDEARFSALPKTGHFAAIFSQGRALRTALLWLSFFLGLLFLYLLLNWLPTLLIGAGLTRPQAARVQVGFNLGGALSAISMGLMLGGRLRNAAIIGSFVALPILLVLLAKLPPQVLLVSITVFLLGCSVLAAQAFLFSMAALSYPTSIRGIGVGAAIAAGRVGSIAGPKLAGYLQSAGHPTGQLLMELLPIVIAGSISALLLAWTSSRVADTHGATLNF